MQKTKNALIMMERTQKGPLTRTQVQKSILIFDANEDTAVLVQYFFFGRGGGGGVCCPCFERPLIQLHIAVSAAESPFSALFILFVVSISVYSSPVVLL